jgi:DNA-directed RNA polymerase specialized sigma24 family protein
LSSSEGLGSASTGFGGGELTLKAIAGARAGDPEGIHYLYARFGDEIRAYAMAFVRESSDALAISHRVFAELGTTISGYDEGAEPFDAWLTHRTRDAALDHLRRRRPLRAEQVVLPEGRRQLLFYED